MPGWGLTVLLAQRIGVARAKQMSFTGNYLDAQTAYEWSLVNEVVPHDELLPYCRQLAADIVSNDQMGVRRMLRTYDEVTGTTVDEGWKIEDARESRVGRSRLRPREHRVPPHEDRRTRPQPDPTLITPPHEVRKQLSDISVHGAEKSDNCWWLFQVTRTMSWRRLESSRTSSATIRPGTRTRSSGQGSTPRPTP